ncbi:hypothetical protein KPH14_008828 [Odynerus spinipes]|uniref:Cyclic nucleotide-binding domain-containing protein n=1 Tax=Odynerus spinipes TaxID=1348599 RepID=A0AAD9VIN9_9HYME|nr:hypothetical protein KPH14_008828 [Odynerus spinipes]
MDLMAYVPNETYSEGINQQPPSIVHKCEVLQKTDIERNIISGSSFIRKLWYWLFYKRVVSATNPYTKWCLKSRAAINYEIRRHFKSYPYMIHPFSKFRTYWEAIMVITSFIMLLINPIFLAFYWNEREQWYIFSNIFDGIILCDIVIWFLTGYYNHWTNMVILDPQIVAAKYIISTFIVDVLSALPYQLIDFIINKTIWYCAILNLIKIIRIHAVITYSRRLGHIYQMNRQWYKLFEMSMIIIISLHWAACLEYYIPLTVSNVCGGNRGSWIDSNVLKKRTTNFEKYLMCLNRATVSLVCSSHYLDMKTPDDILLNIGLSILGILGFIYILARIMQLIITLHSSHEKHYKLVQQLREYMRYKELPYTLQCRLLEYFYYYDKKSFDRYQRIINQVSSYLREEVIMHTFMKFINSVPLCQHMPESVLTQVTHLLSSEIFLVNDVIVKAGEEGDGLYFIATGTVAVYTNLGKEVCHLGDGAHFGDIALFMENMQHTATIIAIETCEIYILYRMNFQIIMESYPDLFNNLYNTVLKASEKSRNHKSQ